MADLFISYAREDKARVAVLVNLLEKQGWSIFWDPEIPPGARWRGHLTRALEEARCVVVVWSEHSIASDWVIEEADDAKDREILVPVLLDAVRPPPGFRVIQAADLSGWRNGISSPAMSSFLAAIAMVLDKVKVKKESFSTPQPDASAKSLPRTELSDEARKRLGPIGHQEAPQTARKRPWRFDGVLSLAAVVFAIVGLRFDLPVALDALFPKTVPITNYLGYSTDLEVRVYKTGETLLKWELGNGQTYKIPLPLSTKGCYYNIVFKNHANKDSNIGEDTVNLCDTDTYKMVEDWAL
jgi:hypothetical protein